MTSKVIHNSIKKMRFCNLSIPRNLYKFHNKLINECAYKKLKVPNVTFFGLEGYLCLHDYNMHIYDWLFTKASFL